MKSTFQSITAAQPMQFLELAHPYFILSKPRIVLLVAVTGLPAMVLEGSLLSTPVRFAAVLLGIILAAASAGALNQYYDRDIDALMDRTRRKRPIPAGRISPRSALIFGIAAGITAVCLLLAAGSTLSAGVGLTTIFWYVVVYTLWLKRRTPLNIVIGGAAGAATPLIGWAAGAGHLAPVPWLMFLVIFLWTPPHFWALSLTTKEEYARAGIPMLPVIAGDKKTRSRITVYSLLLLPTVAALGILSGAGSVFLAGTTLLGIQFIRKITHLHRKANHPAAQELFLYSNLYLAAVFVLTLVRF
jgi:heme o synthase